ncbi:MAG: MFS transporter [Clostridiales bacterium]|mgnify:CR=1 FL=1|nr:MFS transporter [Clostridiales bacterium]
MKNERIQYRIPLYYLVTSLFWFSLYAYVPNLSIYGESLGASHKLIGLILSSYGFTQMILRIPLGIYSDTINRRKIFILLGILSSLISAIGMGLLPNPWALLFFRGLSGVAAAAWVPFTVLFSSYFTSEDSSKAMGYINSFNALGQMIAMLLGGILAEKISPQAPFFLAAGVGALALLLGTGIVEKKENREPMKIKELMLVGRNKNVLIPSSLAVLVQLITFASVYGFTPIAAQKIGANEMQTGFLTTLSTLPGILASAMSGSVFARKFGERKTLTFGFLALSLSCAVIPSINNINFLYLSQMIGGFARGAIFSLLMSLSIQSIESHKRATAMGFFQAIYGLGMFLGPILVGIISDLAGLSWGFWIVGIMGAIGALLAYMLIKSSLD